MIEITLVCDIEMCGAREKAEYPSSIDSYDYHDAPTDGVTFMEPTGWYFKATGHFQTKDLVALCPEHNTEECRKQFQR